MYPILQACNKMLQSFILGYHGGAQHLLQVPSVISVCSCKRSWHTKALKWQTWMLQEGGLYFVVETCRNSLLLVVVGLLLSLLWPTWREGLDKRRTNAAFLSARNMKLPRSRMSGRDILNNLRSIHGQGQHETEKKESVHERAVFSL